MLPTGLVAAALLLSLIPGWWFLRRTEACRRPRQLSSLQEVLELVGVGVLTSGLAVGLGLLIHPQLVLDRDFPPGTPGEVRMDVALVIGSLLAATLLAEAAARIMRRGASTDESEMNVGPWWSVMRRAAVPSGHLPCISLTLSDGTTIDGILHNYTWSPDSGHRDVALLRPIRITRPSVVVGGVKNPPVVVDTPYEHLIVPEAEIKHIALMYAPITN